MFMILISFLEPAGDTSISKDDGASCIPSENELFISVDVHESDVFRVGVLEYSITISILFLYHHCSITGAENA